MLVASSSLFLDEEMHYLTKNLSHRSYKKCWVGPVLTSLTRFALVLDNHTGPHIPVDTLALFTSLNLEEQMADLVDYFGVPTRLTTRKALIGGEDKI